MCVFRFLSGVEVCLNCFLCVVLLLVRVFVSLSCVCVSLYVFVLLCLVLFLFVLRFVCAVRVYVL